MEADDILAYDMEVAGPVFLVELGRIFGVIAERGNIIGQRIEPYINDMLRVKGNGHAPFYRRARNAEVLYTRLDEIVYHLFFA